MLKVNEERMLVGFFYREHGVSPSLCWNTPAKVPDPPTAPQQCPTEIDPPSEWHHGCSLVMPL
jgi:hypothetical protein